jgi:hypothetical protein
MLQILAYSVRKLILGLVIKTAVSVCLSVCLSVGTKHLESAQRIFMTCEKFVALLQFLDTCRFWLKSDKSHDDLHKDLHALSVNSLSTGCVFYLITNASHFPPLLRRTCGRSAESAM